MPTNGEVQFKCVALWATHSSFGDASCNVLSFLAIGNRHINPGAPPLGDLRRGALCSGALRPRFLIPVAAQWPVAMTRLEGVCVIPLSVRLNGQGSDLYTVHVHMCFSSYRVYRLLCGLDSSDGDSWWLISDETELGRRNSSIIPVYDVIGPGWGP